MRRLTCLVLVTACMATSNHIHAFHRSQARQTGWQLGGRYDDTRIIIMIGGEISMRQSEAHSLQPAFTGTRAKVFGVVTELSAERAKLIVGEAAHIGDRWLLDAGRFGWFHVAVERFIVGDWECAVEWGVMASVAPEEQAAFAKVRDNYFALTPMDNVGGPARSTNVGPMAFAASNDHRATIERLLNAEFTRQWPDVHAEAMNDYARGGRKWPDTWGAVDRAIDRGDAKVTYDIQAFRMTPDGEPRLFVRASWRVGSQVVLLMTAWVRAGVSLTVEHTDVSVSRLRGYGDFPSSATEIAELNGLILSVLDTDRNGWGEVTLMRRDSNHDGMSINVLEYPQAVGREPRVVFSVNLGC